MGRIVLEQGFCEEILEKCLVGRISTINQDGYPYTVPVHFAYSQGKIYIHGRAKGAKIEHLCKNDRVCFEVDQMEKLVLHESGSACKVNTEFQSVVIFGKGKILKDPKEKEFALGLLIAKLTPEYQGQAINPERINATGIIEITVEQMTGKQYP